MRKILFVSLISLMIFTPVFAQADQSEIVFERLQIDIWPEYDRSDVLIIYRLSLSDEVSLPADLTFRIPRAASEPYNVAMEDVDGMLYNLDYTLTEQDDWLLVTLTTPSPSVQFEYYDPRIERNENIRDFDFTWLGDYTVQSLSVVIQKPTNTLEFNMEPDMGEGEVQQDGLRYFTKMYGAVEAGTVFTVHLNYDKPNETLSASYQPVEAVEPVTETTSGRTTFRAMLPWMLGVLGLILIAAGVSFWFGKPKFEEKDQRHRRRSASQEETAVDFKPAGNYCHQCGKRAQPGDLFCRSCGAKLRLD